MTRTNPKGPTTAAEETLRLDKWLWAARFFKTRALATEAINGGKVHVNGQRVKAAKTVRCGDTLRIRRAEEEFVVTVVALSARRGPATQARQLFEESAASIEARGQAAQLRRLSALTVVRPQKRPDKHARRQLRALKGRDD